MMVLMYTAIAWCPELQLHQLYNCTERLLIVYLDMLKHNCIDVFHSLYSTMLIHVFEFWQICSRFLNRLTW